jgi:hypothetical protein
VIDLVKKFALTVPIKLSSHPSFIEILFFEHFLNELLDVVLKTEPRTLNAYRHYAQFVADPQGATRFVLWIDCYVETSEQLILETESVLKSRIVALFEDDRLFSVFVHRDFLTDLLCKSLNVHYFPTDLKSELTTDQTIRFARVWAEIVRAVQMVPGIELDGTTSERLPRRRRINSLERVVPDGIPGFLVLEKISIQAVHHNPGIPHESEIEISVTSHLRLRRLESSTWVNLETVESRYYQGTTTKRQVSPWLVSYIPSSQHKCMEALMNAISKQALPT